MAKFSERSVNFLVREGKRPDSRRTRAIDCVARSPYVTLADLVQQTRLDFCRVRGAGRKVVDYIEETLAHHGMKLGMTMPEIEAMSEEGFLMSIEMFSDEELLAELHRRLKKVR